MTDERVIWLAALGLAIAACGGPQAAPPPSNEGMADDPPGVVRDTRTPLERRRDAACDRLGPKLAGCAVEDARAMLAAGKITRPQFEENTRPEVQRALAADWRKNCRSGYMSSRQVRVLEVCFREETECAPLEACLENLRPDAE
ncbi:MAG TPA: hypothetical protein VK932_12235 [Kofleriaceae bacterium]|nr:hypothetical protein [Kofleriaceae bacterium]